MEKELFAWTVGSDMGKLMLLEEQQFYRTQYRKTLNMRFELEQLGPQMAQLKSKQEDLKQQLKVKLSQEHNNGYLFITINPKCELNEKHTRIHIMHFEKKIIKFINRNFCDDAWAVIEQRGDSDSSCGKGYHVHMEIKRNLNYRPSDIIKGVKNTFKEYCNVKNPNLLTCQTHGEDYHKDKLEYIQGVKTGEGKDKKQEIDKTFRKKYNLQVIYRKDAKKNEFVKTSEST